MKTDRVLLGRRAQRVGESRRISSFDTISHLACASISFAPMTGRAVESSYSSIKTRRRLLARRVGDSRRPATLFKVAPSITFGLRDAQFCRDFRERYLIVFSGHQNAAGWASAEGGRLEADRNIVQTRTEHHFWLAGRSILPRLLRALSHRVLWPSKRSWLGFCGAWETSGGSRRCSYSLEFQFWQARLSVLPPQFPQARRRVFISHRN